MQFLKTAFWVVLAVSVALFCKANNQRPVEIKLWADFVWETKVWFPMLLAFLLGAVPFWLMARATRWRMKKRLQSTERALASLTAPSPQPAPITPDPITPTAMLPETSSTP